MKKTLLLITAVTVLAGSFSQCQAQATWFLTLTNGPSTFAADAHANIFAWQANNSLGQTTYNAEFVWDGTTVQYQLPGTADDGNTFTNLNVSLSPDNSGNPEASFSINLYEHPDGGTFLVDYNSGDLLTPAPVPEPPSGSLLIFLSGFALGSTWAGTGFIFRLVRRTAHQNPEI